MFLLTHDTDELDGRRVRFVERDPAVVAWHAALPETPLARLLVAPDAVPNRADARQRGRPRMRCAITLRWISDVPPMIVSERA